jgi:hypothetical protein
MAVRKLTQEEIIRYGLASNDNGEIVKEINEIVIQEVVNEAVTLLSDITPDDIDDSLKAVEAPVLTQNSAKPFTNNKSNNYKKNRK